MKRTSRRSIRRWSRELFGVLYYVFGIVISVAVVHATEVWQQTALVVVGLVLSGGVYRYESVRQRRKVAENKLEPLLEDILLPEVVEAYEDRVVDPPDVRANVMFLRRRDLLPLGNSRKLWPWQKSLQVDFAVGDYSDFEETDLKWAVDEGACGTAIEYNRMVNSDLEEVEIHEWDMTTKQLNATRHLGSVLSIPIYTPEDEQKNRPVGVLNLDSEAHLDETEFNSVGKGLKEYANYIGMLV